MAEMSTQTLPALELSKQHWQAMHSHILQNLPEEACGFVAGLSLQGEAGWRSTAVFPVTNILHSPVRFRLEPHEHLAAFQQIDQQGWELAAIFHSHPAGPAHPSATDIAESAYPDTINLIWSLEAERWACRAYMIRDRDYQECELRLIHH